MFTFIGDNKQVGLYHIYKRDLVVKGKESTMYVGLYRVMFGYRLRAVITERDNTNIQCYDLDICCGPNAGIVTMIYNTLLDIFDEGIQLIEEGRQLASLIPIFEVKPIIYDKAFGVFIQHLRGHMEVKITTDELVRIARENREEVEAFK